MKPTIPRGQAVRDLRRIADGLRRAPRTRDLPNRLYRFLLVHFGSLSAARHAAGIPPPSPPSKWDRDRVVRELRRQARRGVELKIDLMKAGRGDLLNAVERYFGSLAAARRQAGLPPPAHKRSRKKVRRSADDVLREIRRFHRDGQPLAYTRAPPAWVAAGAKHFGSWRNAVIAAGLDYDALSLRRREYSRAEILTLLRAEAADSPETTLSGLKQKRQGLFDAAVRRFGSVESAAKAAGLSGWPRRRRREALTAAQIRSILRRREDPTLHPSDRNRARLWASAQRTFGSWTAAIDAVGARRLSPQYRRQKRRRGRRV